MYRPLWVGFQRCQFCQPIHQVVMFVRPHANQVPGFEYAKPLLYINTYACMLYTCTHVV